MSWSATAIGTKEEVAKSFAEQMGICEARYASGNQEGNDIAAVLTRGLALIEAQQIPPGKVVNISASGSHGTSGERLTNASFKLELSFSDMPAR